MRRLASATVGIALTGASIIFLGASRPVHASPLPAGHESVASSDAPARRPACPLVIQALRRQGTAVQVVMRNQAPYAVDNVVIHVTYADAAGQPHQLAFHMNQMVAQHLTTVYTTPAITGSIVVWSTFAVTTECHMVRH